MASRTERTKERVDRDGVRIVEDSGVRRGVSSRGGNDPVPRIPADPVAGVEDSPAGLGCPRMGETEKQRGDVGRGGDGGRVLGGHPYETATVRFRTRGGFDVICRVVAVGVPGTKGGPAEVLYALTRSDGGARVRNGRPERTRAD